MTERPSIFQEDDLGLDRFAPADVPDVPAQTVRRIAEAGGFPARDAAHRREPLTYRTGRSATLSVKTTPAAMDAFYAIARAQGWKAGETFENAVQALREKLG
jgi:hypothetical protein